MEMFDVIICCVWVEGWADCLVMIYIEMFVNFIHIQIDIWGMW